MNNNSLIFRFYDKIILEYPKLAILFILIIISFWGYMAKDFKLDASAETLVLENDKDLDYSRVITNRYGEQDFLLITYAPKNDALLSDKVLKKLALLKDELEELDFISSVVTILDVPLLESPRVPLKELTDNIRTLESPNIDKKLAGAEFATSPIYKNLLVSPDLKTTAIQINLPVDNIYIDLLKKRKNLRKKEADKALTSEETKELNLVIKQIKKHLDEVKTDRHRHIIIIRSIMDKYRDDAVLFLGGVNMISDDMISYVKNDLKIFGLGVLFILIVTLKIVFKRNRWVALPIICCAFSSISMIGLLGLFDWEVTVISSNFISLQIIITIAITIHLIVRYRELHGKYPAKTQRQLILDTISLMMKPCLFAILTTMAGFASLLLCDILPVKTFGWMMSTGIFVSLILTFLLFPTTLMLLEKEDNSTVSHAKFSLTYLLAKFTENHGIIIMALSAVIFILGIIGISRLRVENCFIDYFKHKTEIYQGMKVIDQNLGGTTPFNVIVEFDEPEETVESLNINPENEEDFDEFDEFEEAQDDEKYWFTSDKMELIEKVHDYLDSLHETGKILSLGTMMKVAKKFNDGKPLDNFQLALVYSEIPDEFKKIILTPYVSVENNEVRFAVRIIDSDKNLQRDSLLKKIKRELVGELGLKKEHVHLTGMLVLYNNMLQSLFESQVLTLGAVVLALMFMFMLLFRSFKIAIIAIFPNLISCGSVLGVMGWMNIPLDMMTITIASISVGIAVDDTIHYIHRFKQEFNTDKNYINTCYRCHKSIGYAMYYTSVAIIIGFSILVFSNFVPTIYFGIFTGIAMLIALLAALTLLPQLIIFFKPFGPEKSSLN